MTATALQLVIGTARALAECTHAHASDYRFAFRDAQSREGYLVGKRCETCGAVKTEHVDWIQPALVRALGDRLLVLEADAGGVAIAFDRESLRDRVAGAAGESLLSDLPDSAREIALAIAQLTELAAGLNEHGMASRLRAAREVVSDFAEALALPERVRGHHA